MHFSGTIVTLYNTLGEDSLWYAFDHTEMTICSWDGPSLNKLLKLKQEGSIKSLNAIIAFDPYTEEQQKAFSEFNVQIYLLNELVELGSKIEDSLLEDMPKPTPDTIEVIWFTSGTTGVPKGAMISHLNYTCNIAAAETIGLDFNENDVVLSYLPLAHCYEKWIHSICLSRGSAIGYFRGDPLKLVADMQILKPTMMAWVPRILSRLHDGINLMMSKEDWKHKLYKIALNQKLRNTSKAKFTHLFWDSILFNRTAKTLIGGRMRKMLTGSAPITAQLLNTMKCLFWIPIVEGFGQTETNAPASLTSHLDPLAGNVGGPLSCWAFKTEDIPEMGYSSSGNPLLN